MIVIKVLICGSYKSPFQQKLCARLKKEKNDVFVLTGGVTGELKPAFVFQDYRFPFSSESVADVMVSISPDVVIFCGAQDASYRWENTTVQFIQYISGLMNVLLSAKQVLVKKFIYLSSCDIFEGNANEVVNEMVTPIALSEKNKTILQGEQICRTSQGEGKGFDIVIIRLPKVYGVEGNNFTTGVCTDVADAFLNRVAIEPDHSKKYNLMYLDDAVDGVYKVVISRSAVHLKSPEVVCDEGVYKLVGLGTQEPIIHFTTGELITQQEIITAFEECSKSTIECRKTEESQESFKQEKSINYPLFQSITQELYEFKPKYGLQDGINAFYEKFAKESRRRSISDASADTKTEKKKKAKQVFWPIIETMMAFIMVQIFAVLTQDAIFHQVVDVYLLYVIIIAVVLGALPSVIAFLLSVLGKFGIIFANGGMSESIGNYQIYLWMIQLFLISILTGYIKDYYKRTMTNLKEENNYLKNEIQNVKEINTSNVEVKNIFEERLINYRDSYAKIYEILSELDEFESKAVMFKSAPVIAEIMNSRDVAIYTYEEINNYCRLIAATSEEARKKGKSFKLDKFTGLEETIKNKRIFMNRSMKADYPILAAGTYNSEKLEVVIMIWSMEIESINLHVSNMLNMASKLLERSMSRAVAYMSSIRHNDYLKGTNVLKTKALRNILEIYCQGEYEKVLDYSLLELSGVYVGDEALFQKINEIIRDSDYVGIGRDGSIYILLTNSNDFETVNVIERFAKNGIDTISIKKEAGKSVDEVFSQIEI